MKRSRRKDNDFFINYMPRSETAIETQRHLWVTFAGDLPSWK